MYMDCEPTNPATFHQFQNVWHTYQPKKCRTTEIIYPLQPQIYWVAALDTVPATPQLIQNQIQLQLPIHHISPAPAPPAPVAKTLIQQLMMPPDTWECSLWDHIQPKAPIKQLKMVILN